MSTTNNVKKLLLRLNCLVLVMLPAQCEPTVTEGKGSCTNISSETSNSTVADGLIFRCSNVQLQNLPTLGVPNNVKRLALENVSLVPGDEPDLVVDFPHLREVIFKESLIDNGVVKWMQKLNSLESVQFDRCWNENATLHDGSLIHVLNIDLSSFKELKRITVFQCNVTKLTIDLTGGVTPVLQLSNNRFECLKDFVWLLDAYNEDKSRVKKRVFMSNNLCFVRELVGESGIYPMRYSLRKKPFLPVMEYRREALVNCPPLCTCQLMGMRMYSINKPQLNVDCIGVNLTRLPSVIPRGASRFNFSYNLIEDISPLYTTSMYDGLAMISLSHNKINYLDSVRFPQWLRRRKKDIGINLDHNKLTRIPAQEIKKVFDDLAQEQRYVPQFLLGNNPFECSCDYIKQLQDLVYHHLLYQHGARDIRCSDDDLYNPGVLVLNLDVGSLCLSKPWLNTVDLVNLGLACLLILIIVSYSVNYYRYRKYQKLPWIITKIKW